MITYSDETPPGGWRYTQAETGFAMVAITLPLLRMQIEQHRRCNRLDLREGWWDEVQMEICLNGNEKFQSKFCNPGAAPAVRGPRSLRIDDLLSFFRVIREWATKHKLVRAEPEEVQRRTAICAGCPFNVDVPGCGGCFGVLRWVTEFLSPAERTAMDALPLKNCGVCGCVLKLKVLLPTEVLTATVNPRHEYPAHCWVRRG